MTYVYTVNRTLLLKERTKPTSPPALAGAALANFVNEIC